MRAEGPVPKTPRRSTPRSRASLRVAGVASTGPRARARPDGARRGDGSAGRRGGLGGDWRLARGPRLELDRDEHLAHGAELALGEHALADAPGARRRDLDGGLVRHDLDHGLVEAQRIALLDEPAHDLALDDAFTDVGQPELVDHARLALRN